MQQREAETMWGNLEKLHKPSASSQTQDLVLAENQYFDYLGMPLQARDELGSAWEHLDGSHGGQRLGR